MTEQLKAEAYVRSQRPALMELSLGCEVTYKGSVGVPKINMCATVLRTTASGSIEIYTSYTQYKEKDELTIIGHPIALHHWLAVLRERLDESRWHLKSDGRVMWEDHGVNFEKLKFNLTTGQPATQADFKAFNDIVGI